MGIRHAAAVSKQFRFAFSSQASAISTETALSSVAFREG